MVNSVENEDQHDRTPSFDQGHQSIGSFPGDFAEPGKWFRQPVRRRRPSRDREFGRDIRRLPCQLNSCGPQCGPNANRQKSRRLNVRLK